MTDFPKDILDAANAAYIRQVFDREAISSFTAGEFKDSQVRHIASAILAERQKNQWQPIETAPKDRKVLLFGMIDPEHPFELLRWDQPSVFSGRWDSLDEAWTPCGATWTGPFMKVTHWMELPFAPQHPGNQEA